MVIDPNQVPERVGSSYPAPYAAPCMARSRRALGEAGGLTQFGVNLARLRPGAWSSQRHWHHREDEFVYVLEGEVVLVTDDGEQVLGPGAACAFKAGVPNGHHFQNRSDRDVVMLVVGTRDPQEIAEYPDADLRALPSGYVHKDGTPY
jgi:uncharacterized cupin superfamily protein